MKKLIQKGFTLVELMTVIIIVAILAAYAVPTFTDYVERKAVDGAVTQLISSVALARSEAITRGTQIVICGHGVAVSCRGSGASAWKVMRLGVDPEVIKVYQPSRVIIDSTGKDALVGVDGDGTIIYDGILTILPKSGNKANGKTVIFTKTATLDKITEWTDI